MKLVQEFIGLKASRAKALPQRCARSVLGASVIRVFKPNTKRYLAKSLCTIPVEELKVIKSQQEYRRWFEKQLARVARCVKRTNRNNHRISPGYKWGHSAKVLNLYLRSIIHNSRYFGDKVVKKLEFWLYVPIDGILLRRMRRLECHTGINAIKEIDSSEKYYRVQNLLTDAANQVGVPRVWFDDNWLKRP